MTECKPKIVSYFLECGNLNYSYNCELCDNDSCELWKEFNEINENKRSKKNG